MNTIPSLVVKYLKCSNSGKCNPYTVVYVVSGQSFKHSNLCEKDKTGAFPSISNWKPYPPTTPLDRAKLLHVTHSPAFAASSGIPVFGGDGAKIPVLDRAP